MVTIDKIFHASVVLKDIIRPTPLAKAYGIAEDCALYLKPECLQKTGSFKLRGSGYKIAMLSDEEKAKGVIACSAGNHAQGVALAASKCGISSLICLPDTAPISKVEATKGYGAQVCLVPGVYDDAYNKALELKEEHGYTFVHPFDDEYVIAGQGTIGLEIMNEMSDVDAVLVPIGGGGLISGVAKAVKELKPSCQVIGVQAEGAASMYEALRQDKIITLPQVGTMADGIQVKTAGTLTFDMCRQYVDKVVTVSESEIAAAILTILEKQKLITEGAGAVSVAAVMAGKLDVKGKTVCALLSGGNVDVTMLERIIKHGLTAEGRIASFSTVLPDQPNALATYLAALSHEGVNVLEVYHERSSMKVGVGSCRVRMVVETRNHEHIHQLYSYLAERGYTIKE